MGDRDQRALAVVILAAGKGTRMKDPGKAKVMHTIGDRPMVAYVIDLARSVGAAKTLLVVGWRRESIMEYFSPGPGDLTFVVQEEQKGTGHAVMQTKDALADFTGDVLVLSGDVPLLTEKTLRALLGYHRTAGARATILTAEVTDATGYGRIVRDSGDAVVRIVEEKDTSRAEKKIREINSGIYLFDKVALFEGLEKLTTDNAQGEYYLTGIFEFFRDRRWQVSAVKCLDPLEVAGINDLEQLESARRLMMGRGDALS